MATKKVSEDLISQVMREMGRKGGQAKVKKGAAMLTPEERKRKASVAAKARWTRKKKSGSNKGKGKA